MMSPTEQELELLRRLQLFWNDHVVHGQPLGDWHVEAVSMQHSTALLRAYVTESLASQRVRMLELEVTNKKLRQVAVDLIAWVKAPTNDQSHMLKDLQRRAEQVLAL